MAFQQNGTDITLVAGADLSAKQFYAVKVNSSGQAVTAGAGEAAIGIVQNDPASGQAGAIRVAGVSKAVAGGNVTAGAQVAANADGKIVTATAGRTNTNDAGSTTDALIGSNVIGVALSGGADGEVISILVTLAGAVPTTAA
jgi:hypothetical protein